MGWGGMCSSSFQASVYFGCSVVKMMHISEGDENRNLSNVLNVHEKLLCVFVGWPS